MIVAACRCRVDALYFRFKFFFVHCEPPVLVCGAVLVVDGIGRHPFVHRRSIRFSLEHWPHISVCISWDSLNIATT